MLAVMVTNIPAPYREEVHRRVSEALDGDYHVVYCGQREANREWIFEPAGYAQSFLKPNVYEYGGRYIHANPDIWSELNHLNPDVVITAGFNPTFLLAFLWALVRKRRRAVLTEGTPRSERHLSAVHKLVRKSVFRRCDALIGVSTHSLQLFNQYAVEEQKLFRSCYSVNNEAYGRYVGHSKSFDVLFVGQLTERKLPLFFVEVASQLRQQLGTCRALVLGGGPMKDKVLEAIEQKGIQYHYPGFVQQSDLPSYYGKARLLLFPTQRDTWGIVANEACATGLPVITCENAGCAGDLVIDGSNGYVLPLDVDLWTRHAVALLTDERLYQEFSTNALNHVQRFNHQSAADAIVDAITFVRRSGQIRR